MGATGHPICWEKVMHIHVRIHRWILWWFYVGVACGAVAVVNILSRNVSRTQEDVILVIGALFWVLGGVVCYRKWEPVTNPQQDPPELVAVANPRTTGINFSTKKENYVSCWFRTDQQKVTREQLRLEVGGYGVPATFVRHEPDGAWLANFRMPPGLPKGWSDVRLRLADSDFGRTLRVAVDMPVQSGPVVLVGACDAKNFQVNAVTVGERGWISSWVQGLPENCDRDNVRVLLDDTRLVTEYVGDQDADGNRQINAVVPGDTAKGEHSLRIECAGVSSESLAVVVV